ncbi:MAG: S41 family peptidase [Defluviitaleaceae bacterium]|nr:S41 family peptidase [Defluviitaleaceae bacterium]
MAPIKWFMEWRERRREKLDRTREKRFRRRYRVYQVGFFMLLGTLGFTVYANFDYWAFRILIAHNYVFTDALDELYGQHILEENRRSFGRDFDRVVISVVTGALSEINNDRFTYLYAPQEIQHVRAVDRVIARRVEVEVLNEDTVRLFIPNISRYTREFVYEHRDFMAQFPNMVLDLRGNYGGWLPDAHRIASLFTPRNVTLSYHQTRMSFFTETITSRGEQFFHFENVVILQDRRTASAAEVLILALREHTPNVVTIGYRTVGKGIGQVTVPLTSGYAVRATVLNVLGPVGQSIHLVGIYPDIPADPYIDMVEQALEIIANSR